MATPKKRKPAAKASKPKKPTKPTTPRKGVLTKKQKLFGDEYLIDLNATQAAIRAGYSKATAAAIGYENLIKPHIKEYIQIRMDARQERLEIDADYVLRHLVREVEADMADLYDENNRLRPIRQWPMVWRQGLVLGVEVDELYEGSGDDRRQIGVTSKLRQSDRANRLVSLGKHVKVQAFRDQVSVEGSLTLEDYVLARDAERAGNK